MTACFNLRDADISLDSPSHGQLSHGQAESAKAAQPGHSSD
jgi:hypothetical protein